MPNQAGAGGGTRTHTPFYGPRILSPVRLPFRHTGAFATNRVRTCKPSVARPANPPYRIKRPAHFLIFAKVPHRRKQPMQQPRHRKG